MKRTAGIQAHFGDLFADWAALAVEVGVQPTAAYASRWAASWNVVEMQIESIADHLDLIDTIAFWHFREWGHADPSGSVQSWADGLRQRTNRDHIPATYVALEGSELLGSVTLTDHDMHSHPEISPWLAGLYVKPERRGQGVGSALTTHVVSAAAQMGVKCLYLYTESARDLYLRLGWRSITEDFYEGQVVTIMCIDIPS